jgi:hypothetical protein
MRKVAFGLAVVGLLTASAMAAAKAPGRAPLLGVVYGQGGRLAWLDPLTLEAKRLSPSRFRGGISTAMSPDARMVVVAPAGKPVLRLVSAETLRVVRTLRAPGVWLGYSIWPRPDRVITTPRWYALGSAIVLDPRTGLMVSRHPLAGTPVALAATQRAIVLLLGRQSRIGAMRLAVVGVDGAVRTVRLPDVRAGLQGGTQAHAGLAIDPTGEKAAVVTPQAIAEVDLVNLTVRMHRVPTRRTASAEKLVNGWDRHAVWVSPTALAITGTDYEGMETAANVPSVRAIPVGLTLVDTRTWRSRLIAPDVSDIAKAGTTLLATAVSTDSETGRSSGIGLRGYTAAGGLRFHLFGTESLATPELAGGLAYFSGCNSFCYRIVDPRLGELVAAPKLEHQTVLVR